MKPTRLLAMAGTILTLSGCELTPPVLPDYPAPRSTEWLSQGWTPEVRDYYHHANQGTLTFGIPYEWFVALEQPALFSTAPMLRDPVWLDKFGFIPTPNGLPVGFAAEGAYQKPGTGEPWINPGKKVPYTNLGLTCAACHTGRFTYQGKEYKIDGGSGLLHLGNFRVALGLSLIETLNPLNPGRFDRFANGVLGDGADAAARQTLRADLEQVVAKGKAELDLMNKNQAKSTDEGFGRLDAINRIGNQVFGEDMYAPPGITPAKDDPRYLQQGTNYEPLTAPVHYPHIWTSSWFTWVQFNGSIMQPMVRNAGESLGVAAQVNLADPARPRFASTVQVGRLAEMEAWLSGTDRPLAGTAAAPRERHAFPGLQAPKWPVELPHDPGLVAKGAALYAELCQGCHLPPLQSKAFWSGPWWKQIDGKGDWYVDLYQIPLEEIGTDPGQAMGMHTRTVKVPDTLRDKITSPYFGPALGQLVEAVTTQYYDSQKPPVSAAERDVMNGSRPNQLQIPLSYKARPLNGIWAAPPFLHNGSVPNLDALLSPVSERPSHFTLGQREFDPVKVGYLDTPISGGFVVDTTKPGNSNAGHEFSGPALPKGAVRPKGVIGRGLTADERRSLIEYLKTL